MPMNRVQFHPGVSMPEFFARYGSEAQCAEAVKAMRWPQGFRCPRCSSAEHYVVGHGARKLFQCQACRHQTSLTAGTVMDSTKLPLTTWSLAIFLLSHDKTGLSALALKRHLGTSYRTAWLILQKLMKTMALGDAEQPLTGSVQVDDAYLGQRFASGFLQIRSRPRHPCRSANGFACRAHKGLPPPSECALAGAPSKNPA